MAPAIFMSLLFLLTSAADGRSLTGCLFSDGQVYPPGEFSPARCTRCTCMTIQVSARRYKYLPICVNTCNPDVRLSKTTTTTTPMTTTTTPMTTTTTPMTTTTPLTTIPWTTTTPNLPCWAYLRFTCPDLDCQGHGSVPHDYANCRCGYCICPPDPSSGTTSRPWSCPTTVPTTTRTTVPFTWPTTTTTTPMLPCRDYLRFTCPQLNCPDAIPHDYDSCVCGYCPNGPTTVPTTIPTSTPTTVPFLTTTTQGYPCWHYPWKFTCPYYKPCVDATPDDYANCRCGQCPNGPNCYAWDGSIIPAGEVAEVEGATCQCPEWYGSSHFADCDFGALTG